MQIQSLQPASEIHQTFSSTRLFLYLPIPSAVFLRCEIYEWTPSISWHKPDYCLLLPQCLLPYLPRRLGGRRDEDDNHPPFNVSQVIKPKPRETAVTRLQTNLMRHVKLRGMSRTITSSTFQCLLFPTLQEKY